MTSKPAGNQSSLLSQLIHPHSDAAFRADYWESAFLHVSSEQNPNLATLISGLLDLDRLDALLTEVYAADIAPSDLVRMGKDGVLIPPEHYMSSRNGGTAQVDASRVLDLHRAGASIILNAVHRRVHAVGQLCREISTEMGVRAHANVYITPPRAQGFPLHFDDHDVFLLQVVGEKIWRLAASTVPLATFEARGAEDLIPQGAESTVTLRRGELLYIPRGMLHEGVTSDSLSAHLTIGMNPLTWAAVMHEAIRRLEHSDPAFRTSVAAAATNPRIPDGRRATVSDLANRLASSAAIVDGVISDLVDEHLRVETPLRGQLTAIHDPAAVDLSTTIEPNVDISVDIKLSPEHTLVDFGSGTLRLPAFAETHVKALLTGDARRPQDLPEGLSDEAKLVLVRKLLELGLLLRGAAPTSFVDAHELPIG